MFAEPIDATRPTRHDLHAVRPIATRRAPLAADATPHVALWHPAGARRSGIRCLVGRGTGPVAPHVHEGLQLLLPLVPMRIVDATGTVRGIGPGQLAIAHPGALHGIAAQECTWSLVELHVDAAAWLHLADSAASHVAPPVLDDAEAYHGLRATLAALAAPVSDDASRETQTALLGTRLSRLWARHAAPARRPDDRDGRTRAGVARAMAYLRAHTAEPVDFDVVAREAFLSKYHLIRAFTRECGLTPHAYLMQLRLARARRLIEEGTPISHAAYGAGFADQSHLTRRFREYYGFTPAAYARAATAPAAPPTLAALLAHGVQAAA